MGDVGEVDGKGAGFDEMGQRIGDGSLVCGCSQMERQREVSDRKDERGGGSVPVRERAAAAVRLGATQSS